MTDYVTIKVYVNGDVVSNDEVIGSVKFTSTYEPYEFMIPQNITYEELKERIVENVDVGVDFIVKKIRYRCPLVAEYERVKYRSANIKHDANTNLMFRYYRRFQRYVNVIELCIDIEVIAPTFDLNVEPDEVEHHVNVGGSSYPGNEHYAEGSTTSPADLSCFSEWREFEYNSEEDNSEDDEDYEIDEDEEVSEESNSDCEEEAESNASYIEVSYEPPPLMRTLDLNAMHVPEFLEYFDLGP